MEDKSRNSSVPLTGVSEAGTENGGQAVFEEPEESRLLQKRVGLQEPARQAA